MQNLYMEGINSNSSNDSDEIHAESKSLKLNLLKIKRIQRLME